MHRRRHGNRYVSGKGLTTALMRGMTDGVVNNGRVPMLDATKAGQLVYQPLGYVDHYSLSCLGIANAPRDPMAYGGPTILRRVPCLSRTVTKT